MNKFLNIEFNRISGSLIVITLVALLFFKISIDCALFWLDQYNDFLPIIIRLILSLTLSFLVILLFFKDFKSLLTSSNSGIDNFKSEIFKITLFGLTLLILSGYLPESVIGGNLPESVFDIIKINVYALFAYITAVYFIRFFIKWVWLNRFTQTKLYLKLLLILFLTVIILVDLPDFFRHIEPDDIKNNAILTFLSVLFLIVFISITFLISRNNSWIAHQTASNKWKLLGLILISITLNIVFLVIDLSDDGDGVVSNSLSSVFSASSVMGLASTIIIIYFVRLAFSITLSLPTTKIIERKFNEFNYLTYLNRIVAQTIDFETLIETVTKLSLNSGNANIAWTELNLQQGLNKIQCIEVGKDYSQSAQAVFDKLQVSFYAEEDSHFVRTINEPLYIESLAGTKNKSLKNLFLQLGVKSIIIMPLLSSNGRVGTLYLSNASEYGFDRDFLALLYAFSDNINIAINTNQLLQESIEKEKYKKELKIAREIEEKLIPHKWPIIKNFSIAGFTQPAEEVGGDYYDIVKLRDGKFCLLIGDVSGKGMSAAFYMILLKGVVLSLSGQAESPSELLKRINKVLYKQMDKQMFITMSAVKIENEGGLIKIARAGHMPFLLKRNEQITELKPAGLGIGLVDENFFGKQIEELTIELKSGNALVMFSDGVIEQFDNENEEEINFLKQILKESNYGNSDDLLSKIKDDLLSLNSYENVKDDFTILCLTLNDLKESS